ncbi:hypothetical protein HDV05_001081 [Chytridiales sp. JEL 0842]|nr:hypothetical protein HDV05_001081 [Chytridiales sp. JEL 0842]
MTSRSTAVKRLMKEYADLKADPSPEFTAAPLEDNMLEWHFTVRGPSEGGFKGGRYHGRILFPPEYPFKPPNIVFLTPNGRFETNKKICLSITNYHPEYWRPAWGVRSALIALISFMPTEGNGAIGALDFTEKEREEYAKQSRSWGCAICGAKMADVLPEEDVVGRAKLEVDPEITFGATKAAETPVAGANPDAGADSVDGAGISGLGDSNGSLESSRAPSVIESVQSATVFSDLPSPAAADAPSSGSELRQRHVPTKASTTDLSSSSSSSTTPAPAPSTNPASSSTPAAAQAPAVVEPPAARPAVVVTEGEERMRQIDTAILVLISVILYILIRRVSLIIGDA